MMFISPSRCPVWPTSTKFGRSLDASDLLLMWSGDLSYQAVQKLQILQHHISHLIRHRPDRDGNAILSHVLGHQTVCMCLGTWS